ncbi:Centrosome and spindle pole-associated protein 1 [Cuculus canorus]|uniref:Centrosome and spindle pole-associated protein 1 n=1 Tax=Cuculus canorus TaxID=55661 RepID=A0A091FPR3_CUCCA|nr:Centrosome and spindle pole-associated protein 1 [Cuculus canorus]
MADDLDKFIEDQKARLAQDKAELQNDPPYMEMRIKEPEKLSDSSKMLISMAKENIPPNSQQNYPLGDYGLSLPLGEEYERKKHKLKEELRQDYRRYLSQEKLRLERNKEYNQYLRDKEEWNERLRKLGKKSTENEMDRNKKPIAVTRFWLQPELHTEVQPCSTGAEPPRKDAFTSTEGYEELQNKRWLEEDRYHRIDDEVELRSRLLNKRLDEDLDVPSQRHHGFASQSVIPVRKHHRLDDHRDFGRRYYRMDYEPERSEAMDPRLRCESAYDRKMPRVFYAERSQELKILGGQDRELLQRKKEKYRQELIEQMAEQQRNKRREKELELSVAASGARDPEKKANRLKQFGLTARVSEEKVPPERPRVAFQTPVPVPSASPVNEDFHRGLASTLGEIAAPRLAPMPPPPPPALVENYRTPYDDAYYFYGVRNPLDPSLAYYGTGMMGMQPTPNLDQPLGQAPVEQSVSNIGQRNTGDRQGSVGVFSEEKTKPSKEATLSYQQELQQQIREREEQRRQEREEKERYEAKLEAEMRNYNPWGKGGGGAPLRDAKGNLITDLNMMHKQNEGTFRNPEARLYEDKGGLLSVDLNLASPRPENTEASTNKIAGFPFAQTSPFARGNVFGEPPSPQHLKRQESYKNFLRLQIEEKRRREEAEREKLRLEEEKEEKRIAEERMRIQKAYEDEQEEKRKKEEERRLKDKEMIRLDEERKKEAEKRRKEKEEKQDEQLRQYFEKEKMEEERKMVSFSDFLRYKYFLLTSENSHILRKLHYFLHLYLQIPSAESRISYYTQDPPQLRPPSPPVPARRNQLRALEERKNVINELSEMKKQLRSEERRLQEQLLNVASDDDVPITRVRREKNPKDIFEMARLRLQAPVRRASSKEAQDPVNIQNIWEFNELKYKGREKFKFPIFALDAETRMGLRHMYPDPPKDDQTLEIQQQALLREQQKKLDRMRMRRGTGEHELFKNILFFLIAIKNESNEFLKNSLLESDSAFIGANGEMFPALGEVNLSPQFPLSARERRRIKQKASEYAVCITDCQTPLLQPDSFSLHSNFSLDVDQLKGKNEERLRRLMELQQKSAYLGDNISLEVDDLLKHASSNAGRRPSSVDTVATEPWLRPGTSETLRRFTDERSSPAKLSPENTLLSWEGLSTAHG